MMENKGGAAKGNQAEYLKGKLYHLERELEGCYGQLARKTLELVNKEQKEIDQIIDNIIEIKILLAQGEHERQCANCLTFNQQKNRYCSYCGMRMKDEG